VGCLSLGETYLVNCLSFGDAKFEEDKFLLLGDAVVFAAFYAVPPHVKMM
jgi:hypothetical protein